MTYSVAYFLCMEVYRKVFLVQVKEVNIRKFYEGITYVIRKKKISRLIPTGLFVFSLVV